MSDASVHRTELSPIDFLRRSAYVYPEKTAVVQEDRRISYAEMEERVDRLANGLLAAGLEKGDRVAFLCHNSPAMLEAHFGVPAAGGVLVCINVRLNAGEVDYIVGHSGSRFLFVDRTLLDKVKRSDDPELRIVVVDDSGAEDDPYERFLAGAPGGRLPRHPLDEEEPISINYTSGTTGRPKGVQYTHRGAYLNALGEVIETGMNVDTVYLWTLPMFHANGWCFTWGVTAVGGTHICLRTIEPDEIWSLMDAEGVTHYNGAPTVQIMLLNSPKAKRLETPVTVTIAGAPPSPTLLAQLRAHNLRPIHVYGLTETYGPITVCAWHREWNHLPIDEQATLLARQGQAYSIADLVRVVDDDGDDVRQDGETIGEVVMRGNIVMKGYFADPEATEEAFRGGWFHSGDLAVWHPDGFIELRDRAKDIIISGGENISTIEVEQTVARHPAVLECAVIAIPDDHWGERPKAFVTLKETETADEAEIIAFCKEEMAGFKCPAAVEFGPLPKTSTGKVQKFVLREREWGAKRKRVN